MLDIILYWSAVTLVTVSVTLPVVIIGLYAIQWLLNSAIPEESFELICIDDRLSVFGYSVALNLFGTVATIVSSIFFTIAMLCVTFDWTNDAGELIEGTYNLVESVNVIAMDVYPVFGWLVFIPAVIFALKKLIRLVYVGVKFKESVNKHIQDTKIHRQSPEKD